ncbi:hypothetical protein D3C72_1947450 [compost metagenome]
MFRRDQPPLDAIEQFELSIVFQMRQEFTHRRLRDMQYFRRATDGTAFDNGLESLDLSEVRCALHPITSQIVNLASAYLCRQELTIRPPETPQSGAVRPVYLRGGL